MSFSEEHTITLKNIGVLRQFGFSIEQISAMIHDSSVIAEKLSERLAAAREETSQSQNVLEALGALPRKDFFDIDDLAQCILQQNHAPQDSNFGQFDELSEEQKALESDFAAREVEQAERKAARRRKLLIAGGVILVSFVLFMVFWTRKRIDNYIALREITLLSIEMDGLDLVCTIRLEDSSVQEKLGTDTISVITTASGAPLEVGQTLVPGEAQLAICITNGDLMKLGLNPVFSLSTMNPEVNNARKKEILHKLFASPEPAGDRAHLWIREISGRRPLFQATSAPNH